MHERLNKLAVDVQELKLQLAKHGMTTEIVRQKLSDISEDIAILRESLDKAVSAGEVRFVPLVRYLPVERVVYGLVGLILTTVIVALIGLVLVG